MKHIGKIIAVLLLSIFFFLSCTGEDANTKVESNADILKNSFDLYTKMKKENEDLVMNLSLDKNGKIIASYEKSPNILSRAGSPELLCKDDTYSEEFSSCVQENVEAGVCVSIMQCAYCAYECENGGPGY